ncbi:hypothetical protein TVAG_413010 [Trichomonas vaginalis G3]|uniref:Uncharacterized protein n=1 Tax=Trichomonas vaginalis (strain ATCC PRA-98 / G3) TaxID=412133 RepID=A2F6I6_TRIV3|nr:hypothetical protein TVAGG3_0002180 [Trichomonas vaginalis G3]EAX99484.1 hypothetical protein TVAG_413010 [Trichomonas vaginalis G3]KAI5538691.1 hypothetical protein TVAGG3_0002180 [Trichomonas vaginalis G3]|eukprot:XP_001312414.1 hypothetical protein [Trichomonas vaginalis G3]
MTESLNFAVINSDNSTSIVDSKDHNIATSIRIQKTNVTLFSKDENTLDIFILKDGQCSDTTLLAQSSSHFSFSLSSSSDNNICVFPYQFPSSLNISIEGNYTIYSGDNSTHNLTKNTQTSDLLLNGSCYVNLSGNTISMNSTSSLPAGEDSDCAAVLFKILSGTTVTTPSSIPSYTMSCEHSNFKVEQQQAAKPPWVVIILLILLICFCIASGIYSCTHKNNSQLK